MRNRDLFGPLEVANDLLMEFANDNSIQLKHIEFVTPFVEKDNGISIWLFFENNEDIDTYKSNGTIKELMQKFSQWCECNGLPKEYVQELSFTIDSEENVMKNYCGNYFFRLRG